MYPNQMMLFALLLVLLSCSNDQETEDIDLQFGYDYFPLEVGRSYEYVVDSIVFKPAIGGISADTNRTFVLEVITDTLIDNTGEPSYRVERFERTSDTSVWVINKVLTLQRSESQAFRTEDNLRMVNLVFPVQEFKRWDSRVFIDPFRIISVAGETLEMFKNWESVVTGVGASYSLEGIEYDDVLSVTHAEYDVPSVETRVVNEVYAAGVGLIFREMRILDTQCQFCCDFDIDQCESLTWEERAEKGFVLSQRLLNFE